MAARANAAPRAHTAAMAGAATTTVRRSPRPEPTIVSMPETTYRPQRLTLWLRAVRLRQWPKNTLVCAAPVAAGVLGRPHEFARVSLAVIAFCLLSSGTYLFNDLRDAREDRLHPIKRSRPIAARLIRPGHALAVAVAAFTAGLGLMAALGLAPLAVAGVYVALNFAYTGWLRRIAIADIVAIAAAFVIRAVAGGVVAGVRISPWFFVVVSFAALLVAAGKRYADFLDPASRTSRAVLAAYNADFLRMVITAALAVAVTAYCLWAFQSVHGMAVGWRQLSVVPLTVALLRYLLLITGGRGGSPEEVLLSDRPMQVATAAWLLAFVLGPVA